MQEEETNLPATESEGPGHPSGQRGGKATGARRPDTGWAWVVMAGSFAVYFASIGFASSLSIYLTLWMDSFETNAVTAGLVISMNILVRGILSPLAGALCSRYGPRTVTMVGGGIFVLGSLMSSISPTIQLLILSNGFVGALGMSLVYVAAVHVLGMYFHTKYALSVGLASAGISAAQLAYPPLVTYLIDTYGWRGSMIIQAGISLHILAAGALMRPLVKTAPGPEIESKEEAAVGADAASNGGVPRQADGGNTDRSGTGIGRDESGLEDDGDGAAAFILADSDRSELIEDGGGGARGDGGAGDGSVLSFVAAISEDGVGEVRPSPDAAGEEGETRRTSLWGHLVGRLARIKRFLLDTFGLERLARNMRFVLTVVVSFAHGFGKLGIVYIVARAESVGVPLDSSALLLSLFGAGSMLARLGHGWFIDRKYVSAEMTYALALLLLSATVTTMPFFVTFGPLALLCTLQGMGAGTSASVVMVIVRSQVRRSDASEAIGVMLLFMNVGTVCGNTVAGISYDLTDTYDIGFFAAGGVFLLATLLCLVVYFLQRAKDFRRNLPAAVFYVKLPARTKGQGGIGVGEEEEEEEKEEDLPASDLPVEDSGIVNPVSILRDELNGDGGVPSSPEEEGEAARRPRHRGASLGIHGFENPLTAEEGAADTVEGATHTVEGATHTVKGATHTVEGEMEDDHAEESDDESSSTDGERGHASEVTHGDVPPTQKAGESAQATADVCEVISSSSDGDDYDGGIENPIFDAFGKALTDENTEDGSEVTEQSKL